MNWTPSASVTPGIYVGEEPSSSTTTTAYSMDYGGGGYYPPVHSKAALSLSVSSSAARAVSSGGGDLLEDERACTNSPILRMSRASPVVFNANDVMQEDSSGAVVEGEHEDLLVFGYECKIFRDDERAMWVEEQKHLIPWMGNSDLLIDRYDCRGALMDISRYEPGSSSAGGGGGDQQEFDNNSFERDQGTEKDLDEERYRDLNEDEDYDEGAYDRATDFKRLQSAMDGMVSESQKMQQTDSRPYAAFQYNYDEKNHEVSIGPEPKRLHDDDAPYVKPVGLYIPEEIDVPTTMKVHAIIEKTAKFIVSQGNQMEIILKTKQAANPLFDFLTHGGSLNPYYKFLVHAIRNGIYRPVSPESVESDTSKQSGTLSALSEYGGGDDDSEHTYLHPSLFRPSTTFPSLSYPSGAVVSSKHSSYSMLVSKIKGTDSPILVTQQPVVNSTVSSPANPDQVISALSSYGIKTEQGSATPARPQKQLPSTQDQLIIEKMASYVIKNGTNFEVLAKNKGDLRFAFLNSDHQYHWYYLNCKERFKAECNAVVASSDFVTYNSTSSSASASGPVTTNTKSNTSTMKKSAVVAEIAELKRKGTALLQGKKLPSNKEKMGLTGSGNSSASVPSTENVFSHASLISSKDKEKPVIRFATSLGLNTGTESGIAGSNRTEVVVTGTLPSGIQTHDENKDKPGKVVEKKRMPSVEDLPKRRNSKAVSENEKEDGELVDDEESTSDLCFFDEDGGLMSKGNSSPMSENEDEKLRRRMERKRKAALFLQKLKLKGEKDTEGGSMSSSEQKEKTHIVPIAPTNLKPTGSSLGDLLNRRLQEGEVSRTKTVATPTEGSFGNNGGADLFKDDFNDGGKSSSSISSRSKSKTYVASSSSSSRSRKKRRRSRSYSSTPSYSSSASGSSGGSSDYGNSYSRKRSSKRKHKKKKKKHEKSSRSSHKSSRR